MKQLILLTLVMFSQFSSAEDFSNTVMLEGNVDHGMFLVSGKGRADNAGMNIAVNNAKIKAQNLANKQCSPWIAIRVTEWNIKERPYPSSGTYDDIAYASAYFRCTPRRAL